MRVLLLVHDIVLSVIVVDNTAIGMHGMAVWTITKGDRMCKSASAYNDSEHRLAS